MGMCGLEYLLLYPKLRILPSEKKKVVYYTPTAQPTVINTLWVLVRSVGVLMYQTSCFLGKKMPGLGIS